MKVVDFHAHLWGKGFIPHAFFKADAEEWALKSPDRTPDMIMPKLLEGAVDQTGNLYIANMDRAGVDIVVLNATDFGIHWSGEEPDVPLEDQFWFYGELQRKYQGRIYYFAFADPRRADCATLLERAVREWGARGYGELTPNGFMVTDEIMQPVFRKCIELDVPVFIHSRAGHGSNMHGTDFSRENTAHPCYIEELQSTYPELTVVIGHSGYPRWWEEAALIVSKNTNYYLDLSNWNLDMHDPGSLIPKLARMRDIVGADHILFSSDQPSGVRFCGERSSLPKWVGFIKNLPEESGKYGFRFTREEVDMILGGNAKRLLKL